MIRIIVTSSKRSSPGRPVRHTDPCGVSTRSPFRDREHLAQRALASDRPVQSLSFFRSRRRHRRQGSRRGQLSGRLGAAARTPEGLYLEREPQSVHWLLRLTSSRLGSRGANRSFTIPHAPYAVWRAE